MRPRIAPSGAKHPERADMSAPTIEACPRCKANVITRRGVCLWCETRLSGFTPAPTLTKPTRLRKARKWFQRSPTRIAAEAAGLRLAAYSVARASLCATLLPDTALDRRTQP